MASTPEAGLIIRQAKDQGLKAKLVSGDGIVSNELASIAGDAVEGTLNTFGPDPTLRPENKELVEKFKAAGFNPEAYTLYSYAAVQVIAEGAKAAASTTDAEAIAAALKKGSFKTVLGDIPLMRRATEASRLRHVRWKKGQTASTATSSRACKPFCRFQINEARQRCRAFYILRFS